MKTGKHSKKEKIDSEENAKIEEKHSTRKQTGEWMEDMQTTFEEHTTWQRSAKKKKQKQAGKQQSDGKENNKGRNHRKQRRDFKRREFQHRDSH